MGRVSDIGQLIGGFRISQAISAAVALGVPDALADGPRSSDELSAEIGAHPQSLYRLLRALASVGVMTESDGRFALTPMAQPLRTDARDSLAPWAVFMGRPYQWQIWAGLADTVRTGESAFDRIHGEDVWTYRAGHPEESAYFDRAMEGRIRRSQDTLLAAYDFGRFRRIVDVGGGNGALLTAILSAHTNVEGVLVDQEHVVSAAPALLESAGVADRCRVIAGDFFESVPADGDAYILSAIIHDWDDEGAARILSTVRRSIPADGTLLLYERIVGGPNEDAETKFMDLTMLVVLGGRERTRDEFDQLLSSSGFRLKDVIPAAGHFVIEGEPV